MWYTLLHKLMGTEIVYLYIKNNFRYDLAQALYVGEKSIILPLLEWLLKERQLLEKRAYLGKYLMKIEVPAALRGDSNFEELYENVRQLQRGLSWCATRRDQS